MSSLQTRHWYSVPAYHGTETFLDAGDGGEGVLERGALLTRLDVLLSFWSGVEHSLEAHRFLLF